MGLIEPPAAQGRVSWAAVKERRCVFFTPKYIKELFFSEQIWTLGSYNATYKQLVAIGLYCKSILIKCVNLLIKHVDLSETCCTHWVDVLAELLLNFSTPSVRAILPTLFESAAYNYLCIQHTRLSWYKIIY